MEKRILSKLNWPAFWLAIGLVILGPFIAYFSSPYPNEDKFYPLWTNALFAHSPAISQSYKINVLELDGKKFGEDGEDFFTLFPVNQGSFSPSVVIDVLGYSYESGDTHRFTAAREKIESRSFRLFKQGRYSIVRIKWDAIERFKTGQLLEEKKLVELEFKKN